jgi:putative transposase
MRRHELTDEQWKRIESLLPGREGDPGRTGADNRRFVNAIFWIAKTGVPWRDLPERFGNWNSVFQRFNRWCKNGVWEHVLKALGSDSELENVLLDSTIVRAHQHAAGAKGGKKISRSGVPAAGSARKFIWRSAVEAGR